MSRTTALQKIALISFVIVLTICQASLVSAESPSWIGHGPGGGTVGVLAIDPVTPTTLYAGDYGGGVYKSINGGESWNPINTGLTNLGIYILEIDPVKPSTLYAGTMNGVFKSL